LGTLRLPGLRAEGPAKFGRRIGRMLESADWAAHHGQTLYLVGGSLRAFARYVMVQQGWPIDDPHGFELSPSAALKAARELAAKPVAATTPVLAPIAGVSASRLASLPDAGALLGQLVRDLRPSRLVFSGWGLREGLLARGMDPQVAAENPLIAGVSGFVEQQQTGLTAAAAEVARWTGRAVPSGGSEPLRRAATMLALASLLTEPNLRAEQAAQWALRKRWIGLDASGRAMIAMAVLANSAQVSVPPELARLASAAQIREATAWGLATRLARRFTGGAGDVLSHASLAAVGRHLVLAVRSDMAALYTDAIAKDLRVLADWLGLQPQFMGLAPGDPLP